LKMLPVVEARAVSVTYAGQAAPALAGCSITVAPGEFVLLTGCSGSGKTTLGRLLAGIPTPGARVEGEVLRRGAPRVAMIFQEPRASLSPFRKVGRQLADVLEANSETNRDGRVEGLLDAVGLAGRASAYPHELSSGENQRVAIARALAMDANLVIADEPTASMDAETAGRIVELVAGLHQSRRFSVLWITHHAKPVSGLASRRFRLENGRLREGAGPETAERPTRPKTAPAEVVLRARGVSKRRGDFVLEGVNLDLCRGRTLALCGPSGSGKSTLARCLARLEAPDGGEIDLQESREFHRSVQLVMPDPSQALNPEMTVAQAIGEPMEIEGLGIRPVLIAHLMRQVRLPVDAAGRKVTELSGGERRRVLIARALAVSPSVLLLDEATNGLDPANREAILRLLMELQRERQLALLWITHDPETLEGFADEAMYLERGRIQRGESR
jgi:peptide/nickel transport system ATP-binding protein